MKLEDDARRSLPRRQEGGPTQPRGSESHRDAGARNDWLARATAIAARWLPLPRNMATAEIICIAHARNAMAVASCAVCADIVRRQPSRPSRHSEESSPATPFCAGAQ